MVIKNARQLGKTPERKTALRILQAGYRAIDTHAVLKVNVSKIDSVLRIQDTYIQLDQFRRIGILGIGKCALPAGKYFERILGKRLFGGIVLDVVDGKCKRLKSYAGSHPVPSRANKRVTDLIVKFATSLDPNQDMLFVIVSGGGSSLFFSPKGIAVNDFISLTKDLHKSGASIEELNCVRKHLSAVQGGKFARMLYPLPICVLYFSDVVGDNLNVIASGPLYPDDTLSADARHILRKYGLWNAYKNKIKRFDGTPKQKKYFTHVSQHIVLTNKIALHSMAQEAEKIGLRSRIVSSRFCGNANKAYATMKRMSVKGAKADVYLAGGETTVHVVGNGKGGRNQQAALAALAEIRKNELFISAASDGVDNTPYAGAIADYLTVQHARKVKMDSRTYVKDNNSYAFFAKTRDYIKTGKTGSNVADLMILYKMKLPKPRARAFPQSRSDKRKYGVS